MSPAPRPVHQRVVGNLFVALRAACAAELETLFAPLDVTLAHDTVMQPDLLVLDRPFLTALRPSSLIAA